MAKKCPLCGKPIRELDSVLTLEDESFVLHYACARKIGDFFLGIEEEEEYEEEDEQKEGDFKLPSPKEIKAYLDEYVIGQEEAKKTLSIAVYEHYKRVLGKTQTEKSNVLMIGPTGVGKTLLVKTLAKMLDVPFAIADATTLTEAGYVGDDVENVLVRLIQAADGDVERAEMGIVCIDEVDKLAKRSSGVSITRDVSGEGVQQALLKMLEGSIVRVPPQGGRKHPEKQCLEIDTTNILFICCGAFAGLKEICEARQETFSVGFGAIKTKSEKEVIANLAPEDLIKYGLIPEFIGRLPIHTYLEEMNTKSLVRILTEPKNSVIGQVENTCKYEGLDFKIDDGALEAIAEKAIKEKTGARGLRTIVERAMQEVYYEFPAEGTVHLTKEGDEVKARLEKASEAV